MNTHNISSFLLLCCLVFSAISATAQTKPEPTTQNQDVVRVDTSLVQTDVMVFDKKGNFVSGLKKEQFQLKVDNKPQEVSFFERFTSDTAKVEKVGDKPGVVVDPSTPPPVMQSRSVIFFVDDLHLAPDSLVRTRRALLEFINNGMGENDQVAIVSPSGQIGFLQQFTTDKLALRTAVDRLNYRTNTTPDLGSPPMSEYIALKIREGDQQAITYYIQEIQKQSCFRGGNETICTVTPQSAKLQVMQRAQQIVVQSAPATDNTLRLLEGLMRSAAQLPGRKLVFVISDGFYLNDIKTGAIDRVKKVTDAAGRAGVVIYTLDARGLVNESIDITNNRPMDSKGLLTGTTSVNLPLRKMDSTRWRKTQEVRLS